MLAAILLVAATQVTTPGSATVVSSHAAAATDDLDRHKRHEIHLAHLAFLHAEHVREEARDRAESHPITASVTSARFAPGIYSCHELEVLWQAAGGRPASAFIAAEIAQAESGGNSWATGPVGERGLWQIHPDHGALSTYDPLGNARAAVLISDDGSDWLPWTTYRTGAYIGRC